LKHKKWTDGYHHGDLKSSLIDSALRLLKTKGPESLSLRELAREAGVSQAAPYRHFKDKKELIAAIIEQGFEKKFQYMYAAIEALKEDPQEMYYACGLAYFRMGLKHPQHFKLMTSSEVIPGPEYPGLLEKASSTFILLREMIKYCQKKGIVGAGNPYHKAMNCWCVVNGFTALYAEGRLGFLGVTPENAEHGLRALLSQYLIGHAQPLETKNFKLFETPESKMMKEMMLDRDHPEVDALFASLN
jgi:AcrR family transcriptional regulator